MADRTLLEPIPVSVDRSRYGTTSVALNSTVKCSADRSLIRTDGLEVAVLGGEVTHVRMMVG